LCGRDGVFADRNHIYGFEVSEGMVSDITDKLLPKIEEWQNRPLSAVYPIVFIDAVHFSVRDDGVIRKLAAYVVLGINEDGMKEVLSIVVGEMENGMPFLLFWASIDKSESCPETTKAPETLRFQGFFSKLKIGLEPTTPSLRVKCSTN
jgi:hypothetical protein